MQQRLHKYKRDSEHLRPYTHASRITDRALAIISLIERYRFLPTSLIVRLIGGNPRITQRHLQALYHKGLINRFAFPRVGNPGEFNYYVDRTQALDLLVDAGTDRDSLDWNLVRRNYSKDYAVINLGKNIDDLQGRLMHLQHELMISRFHAMLELACRTSNERVQLHEFRQGPELWNTVEVPILRAINGAWIESEKTETLPHRPDAFFTLRFPREEGVREFAHFFYEADRKHTSTRKHNRKLRAHFHYIVKQRQHEDDYGIKRVRAVLIETTDMYWADDLRAAAGNPTVSGAKPSPLFWFTTSELFTRPQEIEENGRSRTVALHLLKPEVVFKKVWASPVNDTLYSLLD
jgi:hypothetical protein